MAQDRYLNLQPGYLIANRYEVLKCLGAGSMGMVYACSYKELSDHIIALKVLFGEVSEDPVLAARFRNEIYASYGVNHPNVVKAYEYIQEGGLTAFSMEYIDGGDLAGRLEAKEPLDYPEILKILAQMSSGLVAIHEAGLIHRDLKPENILLTREGDIKIADFGIVRNVAGPRLTEHGGVIGTIEYVSPEYLASNQVDERSDIFSLGVLAYEMVTQESPFRGETLIETMQKKLKTDPKPPKGYRSDCPDQLNEIILKCLQKDPKKRYQKAKNIYEDVVSLADSLGIKLDLNFSKEDPTFKEEAEKKSKKSEFRKFLEIVSAKTKSGTINVVRSIAGNVDLTANPDLFDRFKDLNQETSFFSLKSLFLWFAVILVWIGLGLSLLNHYRPDIFNP
jgi:serine/threonine protein kinase